MTVREHFAAMALQGILANGTFEFINSYRTTAKEVVNYTNFLIEELNKGEGK